MPIYEYKCSECEHELEVIQRFSDDPLKKCPECNKNSLNKLISSPSFRLKGAGWYETDFKTGKKKNVVSENDKKNTDKKNASKDKKSKNKKKVT